MRTLSTIFKYILIVILAIGLYITWDEKERIAKKTNDLKYQIINIKNALKEDIKSTQEKYQKLIQKNKQLEQKVQEQENELQNIKINNEKKVNILIEPKKNDYTKFIKKEKDIIKTDLLTEELKENSDDIKLHPEVQINKETKAIESIKVNVETKF